MIYGKCREDVDALPVGLGLDTVVLLLLVKLYNQTLRLHISIYLQLAHLYFRRGVL